MLGTVPEDPNKMVTKKYLLPAPKELTGDGGSPLPLLRTTGYKSVFILLC